MKKRSFFKTLAALLLIPFAPKKAKSFVADGINHPLPTKFKVYDIYSFVGWLTTKDGRPVFVDNVAKDGWGDAGWRNASFLTGIRRDMCRINMGEDYLQRMDDICEACALGKIYVMTYSSFHQFP